MLMSVSEYRVTVPGVTCFGWASGMKYMIRFDWILFKRSTSFGWFHWNCRASTVL